MNIILAASEIFPFAKTGGLADAAGAMAQVFARVKGNKVAVFLPKYRNIGGGSFSLKAVPGVFRVMVNDHAETVSLYSFQWGKATVYLVDCPKYFDRAELYRTRSGDYQDNDERFILFSKAVLEGAKFVGFKPDIIHCHDWQTGLIPAYLKTLYSIDAFFARTGSMFTIHNIAYQGCFPKETVFKAGFGWTEYTPNRLEYYGGINFLKAGIQYADMVNTVSPGYVNEILSEPGGRGLSGVLRARGGDFIGVLNGIDTEVWDPEYDSSIPRGYDETSVTKGKPLAKTALQEASGLTLDPSMPLVGVVSRFDPQKGTDLLPPVIAKLMGRAQFALLGVGDHATQEQLMVLAQGNPKRVFYSERYDEAMAHRIYAASDMFLMPSRFEPCGLSQMIAMRYGTLPVACRTGGLADTIAGYPEAPKPTGFFIKKPEAAAVHDALSQALGAYSNKKVWTEMVRTAMRTDFSWDKSAEVYAECFKKILRKLI